MIMSERDALLEKLEAIVGKEFVSNRIEERYFYSKDAGATDPCMPEYVVLPNSIEEIQSLVKLANETKTPITPLAGGVTTSGLAVPTRGGIVLDFKRMDRIIELNERSSYVIIEPGVTQGQLRTYLEEKTDKKLQHSIPGAPPSASVIGNLMIYGAGHLCHKYGFNHAMCNGIEVVRANGEICKLGACAVTENWFGIPPMPDLTSLFLNGWFGTTGIITKLSLQLFPNPAFKDALIYSTTKINEFVDAMFEVSMHEICEDLVGMVSGIFGKIIILMMVFSAHFQEELDLKKNLLRRIMDEFVKNPDPRTGRKRRINEMKGVPQDVKNQWLILPPPAIAGSMGDIRKGGGAEYIGSYIPLDSVAEVYEGGREICKKYGLAKESYIIRAISLNHVVMFALNYPYNRKIEEERKIVEKQLADTTELILKAGGIPWKPDVQAQKRILKQTNQGYVKLMKEVKNLLDPNNIMNPGKWEEETN